MIDEKEWYQSKTIWGALIAVGASVAGMFDVTVDAATQSQLTDTAIQLVGVIGALFAIYGRMSATDIIG